MINPIRFSGMASGLDTEQIVKDLMKAERTPLNKLLKKKQQEEWKREDYRELNLLIADFRDNITRDMKLQGTFLKKVVTTSNDAVVSGKQLGNPNLSSYIIENATMAVAGTRHNRSFTTVSSDANATLGAGNDFTFTITGATGSADIDVDTTDSINSVIAKINNASAQTGVVASFSSIDRKLIFTAKNTGSTSMSISNVPAGANALGISDFSATAGTADVNGTVTINGFAITIQSNTFTYDGVEFTLKQNIPAGSQQTLSVTQDEDAIFDQIKSFVDKYNELIGKLNNKISETRYRDFEPLLDEEKEAMDEKTIEKWEEKAKSGLLKNDTVISKALNEMRAALYTPITGAGVDTDYDTLKEIGISTAPADSDNYYGNYMDKGKLYIDEDDLRKAIRENGEDVMRLFTLSSSATDDKTKFSESGLAQRLYDQLGEVVDEITDKAGMDGYSDTSEYFEMGKTMRSINENIDSWERRLTQIEDRYWRKFTAMEKAINSMNSQSAWLSQQLGGGQ